MTGDGRGPGRPSGRPRKTRSDIHAAAAAQFLARGYAGTRMDDVAEALGITKASLYHYVPTKSSLLFDIVLPPYRDAVDHAEQVQDRGLTATTQVELIVRHYANNTREYYPAISIYVAQFRSITAPPEFQVLDHRYTKAIRRLIESGIAAGEFATLQPSFAANIVVGACGAYALAYDSARPGQLAEDDLVEFVVNGLRPRSECR
ncbi:MAG: TetR/AcrR family transcriptional regulator [Nostocoides sp.]